MENKVIVLGIDGASYGMMEKFSKSGVMPFFNKLKEKGIFRKIKSTLPELSSVAWSSIITGKNPAEHGIFGFLEIIPNTYSISYPNFLNLHEKPFWNLWPEKKSIVINVPTTYPAGKLNGKLVSGFVALDLGDAVYPKTELSFLKKINYEVDADSEYGHLSRELFINELVKTHKTRIKLFEKWWSENKDIDFAVFVITGTDRLGHFLYDAYENKKNRFHENFLDFYKLIDQSIEKFYKLLNKDDSFIIISDHGMEKVKAEVFLNAYLCEEGFLKLRDDQNLKHTSIEKGTLAFALDPGRIFLNKTGKYPNGSVKPGKEKKVLNDLNALFTKLRRGKERVIKKIFTKDEIYHGKYLDRAADLVLLGEEGYNLRGEIAKKNIFKSDILEGKHKWDNAIFYLKTQKNITLKKNMTVCDLVPTISQILSDYQDETI